MEELYVQSTNPAYTTKAGEAGVFSGADGYILVVFRIIVYNHCGGCIAERVHLRKKDGFDVG
jgi:hypothetical protein